VEPDDGYTMGKKIVILFLQIFAEFSKVQPYQTDLELAAKR
jgi:hypothetical protein